VISEDCLRGEDAQQQHDRAMAKRGKVSPSSRGRLEALLKAKGDTSSNPGQSNQPEQTGPIDPIVSAMASNPGLTRETAERMANDLGF